MVDISIIIVNYNVKHFLRQCIQSIKRAQGSLTVELIVVDNQSIDGSQAMLQAEFPEVTSIFNQENVGFSTANNQGIQRAKGNYILLLNPDTVLSENTLSVCFSKAKSLEDCGAIGVKLIDGKGNYLPESKRGYPGIWTSFCKFSGLGKIFNRSKFFNAYYLGHLDKNQASEIDVLCGAFMFIPRKVLDKSGLLDEQFFMYGEDIDLSYRIQQAGFRNFYLPETSIIHYKGESTKKASLNYVKSFYGAMKIFANKHLSGPGSKLYLLFIQIAIVLFGLVSLIKNRLKKLVPLVLDFTVGLAAVFFISEGWQRMVYKTDNYFGGQQYWMFIVGLVLLLMLILYIIGHYDEQAKRRRYIWISFGSLLLMLSIYGLMPGSLRFSRGVLILSVLSLLFMYFNTKKIWNKLRYGLWRYEKDSLKKILLVGQKSSASLLIPIIDEKYQDAQLLGVIAPEAISPPDPYYLNDINHLSEVSKMMSANEVIFCSKDLDHSVIFQWMAQLGSQYSFKIASLSNDSLLGSTSKNSNGEWITEQVQFNIEESSNRRLKRIFDLLYALLICALFPIFLIYSKQSRRILSNVVSVILARKTWIAYNASNKVNLPDLKDGVLPVVALQRFNLALINKPEIVDFHYAKNYSVIMDMEMVFIHAFTS